MGAGVEEGVVETLARLVGVNVTEVVRAAGGVVWRRRDERLEVLLVHRPRYDDWSVPKGKAEPGEKDEDCALREVAEETGLRCRLGAEIGTARYVDRHGRPKVVRFWAMEPIAGEFVPSEEVDQLRWVTPAAARDVLSYQRDAELVDALSGLIEQPGPRA